jgi:HSP20 family protein
MFVFQTARDSSPFAHLLGHTLEQLLGAQQAAQAAAQTTAKTAATQPARTPALDLTESAAAYTATLELPGVHKADVQVQVEGKRVTVKAQPAAPGAATTATAEAAAAATENTADFDGQPLINYRERVASRYARSFNLPQEVNAQSVQAKLENGVLTLTLPKSAPHQAAHVTVN